MRDIDNASACSASLRQKIQSLRGAATATGTLERACTNSDIDALSDD
jgi:hypothetical protein